jgi:hypothetical protein
MPKKGSACFEERGIKENDEGDKFKYDIYDIFDIL